MNRFLVLALTLFLVEGRASEPQAVRPTPAPMAQPWDANAWEPGSGTSFWRKSPAIAKEATESPSRVPSSAPPGEKATTSDFSNRQSEK